MAAPTFVGAGAGVTIASGSGAVTAAGSGVAVGDLVVLQVLQDGTAASAVSYSAISGIANLAGTASSLTTLATDQPCGTLAKQHLRVGRATSTTCSVTVATTGDDLYYRIYVFRGVNAGTALTDILENGTAGTVVNGSGATAAITDTAVVTLGSDRLALQFVGVDDDNPLDVFTGTTGGFWTEAVAEFASATGTDAAIQLQIAETYTANPLDFLASSSGSVNLGTPSAQQQAQQFTAPSTTTLGAVSIRASVGLGAPADDVVVEIQTDSSGSPSGTVIGTSVAVNVTGVSDADYRANVAAPITSGTKYWIVLRRTGAVDSGNFYTPATVPVGTYLSHELKAYNGTSWVAATRTLAFALHTTGAGTIDGGSYTMAAADNWGVIGFALKPVPGVAGTDWTQPVDDTLFLSDSATTQAGKGATIPDTLAVADAVAFAAAFARTVPDTVAVTDATSLARDIAQAISDTLSLADATALARDVTQTVADTVGLADLATTAAGKGATVNDTVAVADAVRFDQTLTLADTVALTDVVAQAEEIHIADTLALSDLADPVKTTGGVVLSQPLADTVALTDGVRLDRAVTVSDTVTPSDAVASQAALQRTLADTVAPADSVNTQAALARTIADTLALADAATPVKTTGAVDWAVPLADTVTLADAASSTSTYVRTFADTVALADALTAAAAGITYTRPLADSVTVSDQIAFASARQLELADTITLTDDIELVFVQPIPAGRIGHTNPGRISRGTTRRIDHTNQGRLGGSRRGRIATVTRA